VTRRFLVLACLAAPSLLAVAALPGAQASTDAPSGGIFRVSFQGSNSLQAFDNVDPALAYTRESWTLLDTVCARLMRYRDQPPPQGYQLVPEVAAAPPVVSHNGRTWTFRLRTGFRFSDGRPVRADAFSQAIHRTMAPGIDSPGYLYTRAIVGAEDVHAGRRARATGVVARGRTLAISFTRPVGAFDAWTTMPFFCAVPPTLPPSAEGVRRFPGSGPYAVEEYRPDDRITIRRNRYYGGDRVHHVDGFDVDLHANSPEEVLGRIEAGRADWGYTLPQPAFLPSRRLIDKYGINHSRFWVTPGLTLAIFALNSARPLFKDNPGLRRAVNLALDRSQFINEKSVSTVTDQLVPPGVPGFTDRTIYPRAGDRVRAKALTAANLRGGNITLYVPDLPGMIGCAQCVARHLAEIGLEVEIRPFAEWSTASAYLGRLGDPDEPWDMALLLWTPDFVDPYGYFNRLLDTQDAGGTNLARFDEPKYIREMRDAARLRGADRRKVYAQLDLELSRDAAPLVPFFVLNEATLLSARVGCQLLRPALVLTTVCLKR